MKDTFKNINYNVNKPINSIEMNLHPVSLAFTDNHERAFLDRYFESSIRQVRLMLVLVTFLYGAFYFLDRLVVPDQKEVFFLIRFGIVIPIKVIIFLFSFTKIFRKVWQLTIFFAFIVSGMGISVMLVIAPEVYSYFGGIMLVFIAGYFFTKLRFLIASIAGLITVLIYNLATILYTETAPEIVITINFFFISTNIICMFASYSLEFLSRRDFFQNQILDQIKAEVEEANRNLEFKVDERTKELQKAKEIAEESDERFLLAMDASNDGLFDWNLETNDIYFSPRWKKMLGYAEHELPNDFSVWEKTTDPEEVKKSWKLQQKLISKEIDRSVLEFKMKHKDGHWVDILSQAKAIFNESGKAVRIVGIHTEITERKQAEEKLKLLNSAVEASSVSVIITDAEGNINYVNTYFKELTGYSHDEMLGKKLRILKPGKLSESDNKALWNAILSGKDWMGEYQNKKKNGEHYWEKAVISPIMGSNGEVTNFIAIKEDITELRKMELAKIENYRLKLAGELSASIAHDFNNALQSILGSLELVLYKSELPESSQNSLNTAINLVLDVSGRVAQLQKSNSTNQSDIKFSKIDLNKIITGVISQTKPLWKDEAEKKGTNIEIHTNFGEDIVINGISGELSAAIFNIVKNSIEAISGIGQISIETGKRAENVYVTFKDTGAGMDEETKIKIFQPYFTTKGFEMGRGLGMSGVFRIIKEHNGTIFVKETKIGEGTTIELLFPG